MSLSKHVLKDSKYTSIESDYSKGDRTATSEKGIRIKQSETEVSSQMT